MIAVCIMQGCYKYSSDKELVYLNTDMKKPENIIETDGNIVCKGASTLLVLMWLAMLASNVDDMTSHETSKFLIFNLKTIANKLKYDYSLYTLRVNIRILTRRSLASNWSSVDEDLRAQVKARRVSRRAQAWVMWTRLNSE